MKLQIDTTQKAIKIEESVNLGELTGALDKLLPNGEWKEFKLETNTVINWSYPIVVEKHPYVIPYNPWPWWRDPVIYTADNQTTVKYNGLNDGVYCVDYVAYE